MKKLMVLVIAIMLLVTGCGSVVAQSNVSSSLIQSQYLFRNINLGMTRDDVVEAEKENGTIILELFDKRDEDKTTLVRFSNNNYIVKNALFDEYVGSIIYYFHDDGILWSIQFAFDNPSIDIYNSIKKDNFHGITSVDAHNDEKYMSCEWEIESFNTVVNLMYSFEKNDVSLLFNESI